MPKNYHIQTLGCQMNYSDTERIETVLNKLGLNKVKKMDDADLIIFNTCSVRQKAEDRVYGQMNNISKLRKKRPGLVSGITGCMVKKTSTGLLAENDPSVEKLKELDFSLRIEDLPKLPQILEELWPKYELAEINEANLKNYFKIYPAYSSTFQAFVPIGTGCDNFCTYCIVPYSRKREKSRPIEEIVSECERLVKNGCIEITLLGQNVNSYGKSNLDKKTDEFKNIKHPFVLLLEEIDKLKKHGLKRLRFTSNHPKDLSDELIEAMASFDTLMPYLHLPVQAGNDEVLRKMNRNYTADWYRNLIKKLKNKIPDIAVSTDIIVGFCGETEEQFNDTYELFKEIKWDMAYIAQYSPRKGTFSAENLNDDVNKDVKKQRWHKLNSLLKDISYEKNKEFEGKNVKVLVENYKNGISAGRSEHFKNVKFSSDTDLTGKLVNVNIERAREWLLEGLIQEQP
jgi:tRNA-2-methylthio-N6-dimethylallyladenosine synthase